MQVKIGGSRFIVRKITTDKNGLNGRIALLGNFSESMSPRLNHDKRVCQFLFGVFL